MIKPTRGVVLLYEDLCEHWIRWCREGNLTSLGVHKIALPSLERVLLNSRATTD